MDASVAMRSATVRANGLQFGVLEAGSGPLALCLHGFPDAAYTWRHLLPVLAGAGFHAVAPFMRGYAPTRSPPMVRGAERLLAPSSRMLVIDEAGHFPHMEEPGQVNDHILGWVT